MVAAWIRLDVWSFGNLAGSAPWVSCLRLLRASAIVGFIAMQLPWRWICCGVCSIVGAIAVSHLHLTKLLFVVSIAASPALAQKSPPATPGVITEGSSNTSVGGSGAARAGDRTSSSTAVRQGSPDVFINGRPAVTTGDKTGCGGIVVGGGSNVFINGKPVARAGDVTTGCPEK